MDLLELSTSLRTLISALHKGLRKQSYSANSYSMTEMETIGHLLRNASLSPSELAALTRIKTQSISQILKKLEEQGIIRKTPSKDDRRKTGVSLTAEGKKMVDKIKYDRDEWLKERISESLSAKEIELLGKILPILNKLAGAN